MKKLSDESLINPHLTTITPTPTVPVPSVIDQTVKTNTTKKTRKKRTSNRKNNFPFTFLVDFGLYGDSGIRLPDGRYPQEFDWIYSRKALERFHVPGTYRDINEDEKHFKLKSLVHDYIYENYYLENECKFFVTTELKQVNNCFWSYIDGKMPVYFTLDVCVIRENDCQVFAIEIDGPEHYTKTGMMKADIRDEWLKDRYGLLTWRIDKADDDINYKKLDRFISQLAVENPNSSRRKRYPTRN